MEYVKIRALTNQKKESLRQTGENRFEIAVREKAERGEANRRILTILQEYFKNPPGGVKIINGQQSPIKLIRIGRYD